MVTGNSGVGAKITEQAALTARLMLYGLLAVVLMAMDHRGQYVPRLRSLAGYLAEPVYHVIEWPIRATREVFGLFRSSTTLNAENEKLREQLLLQRGDLQRLSTLMEENRRLRALLDGTAGQQFDFQFAELVEVDLDPFSHKVIIDQGASDGIVVGRAVIDGAGVMGQVEEVHPHFSTVRLISDPNHALPVQINRTGFRTVAFGSGDTSVLSLSSVPREADVREGDLVVTSGLGDRFPSGYPVAEVAAVDRQEGQMFANVYIRPLAALDRGREVLLIRPSSVGAGEAADEPVSLSPLEASAADMDMADDSAADDEPEASESDPIETPPVDAEPAGEAEDEPESEDSAYQFDKHGPRYALQHHQEAWS